MSHLARNVDHKGGAFVGVSRVNEPRRWAPYQEGMARCIGGTFMENISVGDQVTIMVQGKTAMFVYSRDADGSTDLTFEGELIAPLPFNPESKIAKM